ncbi:mechanosensitive ion channel family protein [Flavilitoribacter nigricans]|nr:mechanosensitive ion channel family protein [Flavilitoribacter nigricans]
MIRKIIIFTLLCISGSIPLISQIDSSEVNDSPYGVIYNHLYYLQTDSYQPARAALSFAPGVAEAEDLAIQLKQILDGRGLYVDINRLPTENSYYDSLAKAAVYYIDQHYPLLYVEKIGNDWFYSRTTVEAIPDLHRELFPLGTQITTYFQAPFWQTPILNIKLWKWMGIIVLLLLSWLVFTFINWLSRTIIRPSLRKRIGISPEVDKAGRRLYRLFGLLISVRFFAYILPMLQLPAKNNSILLKLLGILSIFFIIFIVDQLVKILFFNLNKVAKKTANTLDDQLMPVLKRITSMVVWAVGLFYILDYLNVNVTALLAGISIGGLAIALAAQDTVKNFFGSIMIFLDKPFQIGDWIHFGNVDGVVEEVGVRSTRIRTFANSITYVPNGQLADQVVDNMGLRQYRRFKTEIGVTYDTPPKQIDLFVKGIREIILRHPTTRKDYFEVHLNSFGASSLNILLYTFFEAPNWTVELKGRHEVMYAIIALAHDLGVRFAFPTQTLHIEEFPGQLSTTPGAPADSGDEQLRESLKDISKYFKTANRPGGDAGKIKPLGGE